VQRSGTFAGELAVIRAHGLDNKAGLALQANELANPEAGKVALRGCAADIIVADWYGWRSSAVGGQTNVLSVFERARRVLK